jgi:hypothetical protein
MLVKFGTRELEMGGPHLDANLRDSSALLDDMPALRQRFEDDGYLFLRGLIDRDAVLRGRQSIIEEIVRQGSLLPGTDPNDAVVLPNGPYPHLMGRKGITHEPSVRRVLEGEELFKFYERFFGTAPLTFDYKWMRAVRAPDFTGAHIDVVYMGRGCTSNLRTTWIPFSDIPFEQGPLVLCVGSHKLPGFARLRETYGKMDVDRDLVKGSFSSDPLEIIEKFGGKWQTANFRMGDVLLFGMYTLHSSLTNTSDRYRISCDVRFQPANEPVDERWVGENPKAHYAWHATPDKMVDMSTMRDKWGV